MQRLQLVERRLGERGVRSAPPSGRASLSAGVTCPATISTSRRLNRAVLAAADERRAPQAVDDRHRIGETVQRASAEDRVLVDQRDTPAAQ